MRHLLIGIVAIVISLRLIQGSPATYPTPYPSPTEFPTPTPTPTPGRVGDFNRDGFTDYVLFNSSTRRTAIWNLHNNVFLSSIFGPIFPVGWTIAGVADVNRDNKPDFVLLNPSTRQTAVWFLNNATSREVFYPISHRYLARTR